MATGLRWTPEQYAAAAARAGAPTRTVAALLTPHANGKIPRAEIPVLPAKDPMPGVDIDAVHRKGAAPKYRNRRVVDEFGEEFDSEKEAKRARELRLLLKAGEIRWWAKQVSFGLPGQTTYKADFVYQDNLWRLHVEDIKSPATRKLQAYRIKVRQMKEIHGIEVEEK